MTEATSHRIRQVALILSIVLITSSSPLVGASVGHTLDVMEFGAVCDGTTDDTLALRSAILAADTAPYRTLLLPPSACAFTDTLVFGGRTDRYSEISMTGHSEYTSTLAYNGPKDRPAVVISHMSAFSWRGFAVQASDYAGGNKGTSVGIQLDGPPGNGTANTTMTFDHIAARGFHMGMVAGNVRAASEIDCRQCQFAYNDIGFTSSGYNALNFWFYGLSITNNGIGVRMGGPWVSEAVHVFGGDSSHNTTADFYFGNSFDSFSVDGFRAEIISGAKFMTASSVGAYPQSVVIRNSAIIGSASAMVLDVGGYSFRLENSVVIGLLRGFDTGCRPYASHLDITVSGSSLSPTADGWPVQLPVMGLYRYRFSGNNTGGNMWMADASGTLPCS